jgi:hypothetical protein
MLYGKYGKCRRKDVGTSIRDIRPRADIRIYYDLLTDLTLAQNVQLDPMF